MRTLDALFASRVILFLCIDYLDNNLLIQQIPLGNFTKRSRKPISLFQLQSKGIAIALRGCWILLLTPFLGLAQGSAPVAEFTLPETSPAEADEGHLLLEWKVAGSPEGAFIFELQQADTVDFQDARTSYQGPDEGSYISGLPAGSTFFRVRMIESEESSGPWSEPLEVQVQFPPRWKVIVLMVSGSFMFVLLIVTILYGRKSTRKGGTTST